jgi:DNA polymerase I-like protein with 3'-5' exonuclease and polymerase domains
MIELRPALRDLGGRGVLCVHDEYLAEVPSDRAEQARALVQQIMQDAMASLVDSVPILVEARVAPAWSP